MSRDIPARCDLDAEAAVLSSALLSEDAAVTVVDALDELDFYSHANRLVFQAIRALLHAGTAVDVTSVASHLRMRKQLEAVGGSPYLAQLLEATPAVAHVEEHARIVRSWALVRRAGEAFQVLAAEARSAEIQDVQTWLESAEARAFAATNDTSGRTDNAQSYWELAETVHRQVVEAHRTGQRLVGHSTGFRELDEHTSGFAGGDLVVVAGRPGQGKTALAMQIGENIARTNQAVVVFSLELTRQQLLLRSWGRLAGVPAKRLAVGQVTDWDRVVASIQELAKLPIAVDDTPGVTPYRVRSGVRRQLSKLRQAHGDLPLGAVIIDYVQLMSDDPGGRPASTRALEIGEITRKLKIFAKEMGCPVIVLSQLKRPVQGTKVRRPEMADLRDSGAIEADADIILAVHREDMYRGPETPRDGLADLLCLKSRRGGETTLTFEFDGPTTCFRERPEPNDYDFPQLEYDERYP